jgi:hypothetical protein
MADETTTTAPEADTAAAVTKVTAGAGMFFERAMNILFGEVKDGVHEPTVVNQLLIAVVVMALIALIGSFLKLIYRTVQSRWYDTPWIVKDMHDAKQPRRIMQNPNSEDAIPIRRSMNEHQGLEFSYASWIFVDDFAGGVNKGQWKHIFHKGSPSSYPNRAPGVWFHPNTNSMRIYMNTYSSISNNYIDVHNIPINKWYQFALVVREKSMDVYINGYLKKRAVLDGIPKQNFGDLFLTQNGGFSGYISRMRYFDYAAKYAQIEAHLRDGPSSKMPASHRQKPPYLTPYWWFNNPNAPTAGDYVE